LAFLSRCVAEILTAVALLSTDNIFINPHRDHEKLLARQAHKRFAIQDGDLLTLVNIYSAWMKVSLREVLDHQYT
jgi:ATP-dependent RNA helicase DDX35